MFVYIDKYEHKKSSHCQYNEDGLRNMDVTWQPRRVDCNAQA